jgi:hypothetical protein
VDQAVRRLVAEPSGKPLLAERLITLEQLSRTADAVDHHAIHGTDESRAHVQQQFNQTLETASRLWHESGIPNGLVFPALGGAPSPERAERTAATADQSAPDTDQVGRPEQVGVAEVERLRRMVDWPRGYVRRGDDWGHDR